MRSQVLFHNRTVNDTVIQDELSLLWKETSSKSDNNRTALNWPELSEGQKKAELAGLKSVPGRIFLSHPPATSIVNFRRTIAHISMQPIVLFTI